MDKDTEAEIFDRIRRLETRVSILDEKLWKLIQGYSGDFPASPPESDSDEPIIDG